MRSLIQKYDTNKLYSSTAFLCLISLFVSLASWVILGLYTQNLGLGDSDRYSAIALDPFTFTESPWGYRVIVPWAARGMYETFGLPLELSFEVLQFFSATSIILLLLHVSRVFNVGNSIAGLCVLAFIAGYQYVYYRHNYIHVGMAELSLLAWILWWSIRGKLGLVFIGLCISVLLKESVAFVALQVIAVNWLIERYRGDTTAPSFMKICVIGFVPIFLFIITRLYLFPHDGSPAGAYLNGYSSEFFTKMISKSVLQRLVEYFTVYGALLLVLPFIVINFFEDKTLRVTGLWFLLSSDQLLLALDNRRMAIMAILALLIAVLRLCQDSSNNRLFVMLLMLQATFGLAWVLQLYSIAVLSIILALAAFAVCMSLRFYQHNNTIQRGH